MDKSKDAKRVRYSEEKRNEVLNFIKEYNADNKRGGQKAAAEKYNITQITLSNWMKKDRQTAKRRGPRTGPRTPKQTMPSAEYAALFGKLADLHAQIAMLEKQAERLDALRLEAAELQRALVR